MGVGVVCAEYRTGELLQEIIFFIRGAIGADYPDCAAALGVTNLLEAAGNVIDNSVPRRAHEFAVTSDQRLGDAILAVCEVECVTALDAEEIAVDSTLVAVVAADDLHAALRAANAESCLAAVTTMSADRAHMVHLPRTRLI